jgi:hypothetical protein
MGINAMYRDVPGRSASNAITLPESSGGWHSSPVFETRSIYV